MARAAIRGRSLLFKVTIFHKNCGKSRRWEKIVKIRLVVGRSGYYSKISGTKWVTTKTNRPLLKTNP